MKEEKKAAKRLIQLVRVHAWSHRVILSDEERELFAKSLRHAGFEVKEVVAGFLRVECLAADQQPTGERLVLNKLCQHVATSADGSIHTAATEWLNRLVEYVRNELMKLREHEEESLAQDIVRLMRDKKLGITPVPEGTTVGRLGEVHLLPAIL